MNSWFLFILILFVRCKSQIHRSEYSKRARERDNEKQREKSDGLSVQSTAAHFPMKK